MKRVASVVGLSSLLLINSALHAATLRTVALTGQPAAGTASGVNYNSFSAPVLNDAGQTAFFAGWREIWATDRTGAVQLIARVNDPLEVGPGNFRIISDPIGSWLWPRSSLVPSHRAARCAYWQPWGFWRFSAGDCRARRLSCGAAARNQRAGVRRYFFVL
jgi:hypothetical protein